MTVVMSKTPRGMSKTSRGMSKTSRGMSKTSRGMSKTSRDMSKIEAFARQCTIFIREVYDSSGQMVIGTEAYAEYDSSVICKVTSDLPCDTAVKLAALLAELGMAMGKLAIDSDI
jgi:hypothetical protein